MSIAVTAQRAVTAAHRVVYKATGGRLLGNLIKMPVVILTTTGRSSGLPRETVLTAPIHEPGRVVLVASNGGAPQDPQWFRNLQIDPAVTVTIDGTVHPSTARVLDGAERDEAWEAITSRYRNYAGYQRKTTRVIPLVSFEY
jgi:deazaflavin-dependent oxidoreductase (nitroreductase family)